MDPWSYWLHNSSTIIEATIKLQQADPSIVVAYFYFEFNDKDRLTAESLIRSLIKVLHHAPEATQVLECHFRKQHSDQQQPNTEQLLAMLKELVTDLSVYIVLDALDECSDREDLLTHLETIRTWELDQLRILAKSRQEADIEAALELLMPRKIQMKASAVNIDRRAYTQTRLSNDRKLKKWSTFWEEIENSLMEKSKGM